MDQKKIISDPDQLFSLKNQIKNIILDFGGVLFDIDYQKPIEAFKSLGLKNFETYYHKGAQSELFDRLETGECAREEFIETIKKDLPTGIKEEEILQAWNSILIGIEKGTIEKVKLLKENYRTFLLSNTNEIHVASFEKTIEKVMGKDYFKSSFEAIYYSNELGKRKPHPETFLEVCKIHELLPNETLFVDDSIQHAIGASRAGLHGFHLDLTRHTFKEIFQGW